MAENVWIGAGSTILPGVSTGRDAVVAASAVVADAVGARGLVRHVGALRFGRLGLVCHPNLGRLASGHRRLHLLFR